MVQRDNKGKFIKGCKMGYKVFRITDKDVNEYMGCLI